MTPVRKRARGGMTLMELTIALVITGLMVTAGGVTFRSIIDRQAALTHATAAVERAAALRDMLHSWLASGQVLITSGGVPQTGSRAGAQRGGSVSPSGSAFGPSTSAPSRASAGSPMGAPAGVTAAQAVGDELDFTTMAPNPADAPQARMRLFIDGDDDTPETGLTLEYQADTQTPLERMELEPAVDSMVVEFLDTRTNLWYPASEAATIQPRAMRLTLLSTAGSLPGILTLPMIVPMGQQSTRPGR
jgi:type II secretory pathway pseudopilin PulG